MAQPCSLLVDHNSSNPDSFFVNASYSTLQKLNLPKNSCVEIIGNDSKIVICTIRQSDKCSDNKILVNRLLRHNLGVLLNEPVLVRHCLKLQYCNQIDIAIIYSESTEDHNSVIYQELAHRFFVKNHIVLCRGNKFVLRRGSKDVEFVVVNVKPDSYGLVNPQKITKINYLPNMQRYMKGERKLSDISYEEIGGYSQQLQGLRELEFPLRFPSFFRQLKVGNPHVVMHGPQGLGKLLMAKAFANETNAHFVLIDESVVKDVSVNIAIIRIRTKLEEARTYPTSVVCFNGLHEIAPRMATRFDIGDHKLLIKELTKMLKQLEQEKNSVIILIGITHLLSQVNTGVLLHFYNTRNDKDFTFGYPNLFDRHEIIKIHTRNLKLSENFDFNQLVSITANYTSARIAKLCKQVIYWVTETVRGEDRIGVGDDGIKDSTLFFMNQIIMLRHFQDMIATTSRDTKEDDLSK